MTGTNDPARGQRLVLRLAGIGQLMGETMAARLESADLARNVPAIILCELALRGPLRPRDLLATTHLSSGGLTKQLDHLESAGMVQRAFGTVRSDRRASVVSLTPDGRRATGIIAESVEQHIDDLRSMIDDVTRLLDS